MNALAVPSIAPDHLYPIRSARVLLGLESQSAWRSARQAGLAGRIRYVGKRAFLLGGDIIDFVGEAGKHRS